MSEQRASQFAGDPERICRARGHDVKKPHPKSSFWDQSRPELFCARCCKWVAIPKETNS